MKTAYDILMDIWQALEAKKKDARTGLETPNTLFVEFSKELGQLNQILRYPECLHQMPVKEVQGYIRKFIHVARKAAALQTDHPATVHRIVRDIFSDLGLTTLISDCKIFFPERTRHLFQILVALDLKIEKSTSGVTEVNIAVHNYYDEIAQSFHLLLDSHMHDLISKELENRLTEEFVRVISKVAHEGDPTVFHRQNAMMILTRLGLSDLIPRFENRFPESDAKGMFIMSGNVTGSAA